MNHKKPQISICWLRRDLRLEDNNALYHSLQFGFPVLILFIFDQEILCKLSNKKDKRIVLIHQHLEKIQQEIINKQSSLLVLQGKTQTVFQEICLLYDIQAVFINRDYEPYARSRDQQIKEYLNEQQIPLHTFRDQVIFEPTEVLKADGSPYTVFTPYAKMWKQKLHHLQLQTFASEKYLHLLFKTDPFLLPSLEDLGFEDIAAEFPQVDISRNLIQNYEETRNFPFLEGTSNVSISLRFGFLSIRTLVKIALDAKETWLNELIWREFFMMILYHFPHVVEHNFKRKYDAVEWRNNEEEFEKWCQGNTGYPIIDAGMRQLNQTGWMHNRVRMVVAGFLCKHLLIDWRWGEAYFAEKLLDFELSSNNGNWQWAAGTGCDAAPYFRIFNPSEQLKKFDPDLLYIQKWIKDYQPGYLPQIVEHDFARKRALETFKKALTKEDFFQ